MTSIGWKRFKFFDEERRGEAPFPEGVTAACAGTGDDAWLATSEGLVFCVDRDLAIKATLPAFKGPVHFLAVSGGKLVALGEDGSGLRSLTLKAWELAGGTLRGSGAAGAPPPLASVKVFAATRLPEGTLSAAAVSVADWPQAAVAVGTSTGAVHLLKGDAVRGKLAAPFGLHVLRGCPAAGGVTSLHFSTSGDLFALSSTSLAALSVTTGQPLLEDDCGAAPGCSAVTPAGELLVAGPDAAYFYTAEEGRKAAVAIRGVSQVAAAFKHYVVAVVPDDDVNSVTSGAPGSGAVLRVFDVSNKIVAATAAVEAPVRWAVAGGSGARWVLAADASGAAVRFAERSLDERLESLFRSRSFQMALRLAEGEGAGPKTLSAVHRSFGDFLHSKRDYDAAAAQYAATVGVLEPSYVIQRFLDAQRVHNLAFYLEALHAVGLASADHTTLLLTCYTKLRDTAKIDAFIGQDNEGGRAKFDAAAAAEVLAGAGYSDRAAAVACTAGLTDTYLSILLEDPERGCGEALAHVRGLGRRAAAAALHRFGRPLLRGDAVGATALLMELCLPAEPTNHQNGAPGNLEDSKDSQYVANLADFTHLYSDRPEDLRYACVTILAMGGPDLPSRQTLYHTLLDLYLGSSGGGSGGGGGDGAEALELLKRGWPPGQEPAYDVERALTTCRLHAFRPGLVFLHVSRREYREAAAVHADGRDWSALLQLCDDHGDGATGGDPEVWLDALERTAAPAAGPGADAALRRLLDRIEAVGVLPPLSVLQVLARNPHLRLEIVRGYVERALHAEDRAIAADVAEAERLREEVERARATATRLAAEPVVFQSSRDAATGAPLELPSVHFLCGHSFNLRTLGEGTEGAECPLCAPEHRRVRELQRSHAAAAADRDGFFRQLRAAPDGFDLVAEYFGRGMLNQTSVTARK